MFFLFSILVAVGRNQSNPEHNSFPCHHLTHRFVYALLPSRRSQLDVPQFSRCLQGTILVETLGPSGTKEQKKTKCHPSSTVCPLFYYHSSILSLQWQHPQLSFTFFIEEQNYLFASRKGIFYARFTVVVWLCSKRLIESLSVLTVSKNTLTFIQSGTIWWQYHSRQHIYYQGLRCRRRAMKAKLPCWINYQCRTHRQPWRAP